MDGDAYNTLFSFLIPKEESNHNDIKDEVKETIKKAESYEEGKIETEIKSKPKKKPVKSKAKRRLDYSHKVGQYKCSDCDYRSNRAHLTKWHHESIHLNIKRYYCNICQHKTYHAHVMKAHMKTHYGDDDKSKFCKIGCEMCENNEDHDKCQVEKRTNKNI